MQNAASFRPKLPAGLNLGSGKDYRDDFFNLDIDETWGPDAVCDLSATDDWAAGVTVDTMRFGRVTLQAGTFETIIANDVLEHVPDLMAMMTACLHLLCVGGLFQISVPYDLSFGAWQDPTHVRAFNERSWLYYTEWFWYMGWSDFRFALETFDFVPSPLGEALRAKDVPRDDIIRTPRAIDSMSVGLRKIALTPEDRATWAHWRERQHAARTRRHSGAAVSPSAGEVDDPSSSADRAEPSNGPKAFDGRLSDQRDRYCLWIVTPPAYPHQHAYDDVATGLAEAFAELGGSAPIIRDPGARGSRTMIVFGAQLLSPTAAAAIPATSVLFNLEQADRASPWMSETYLGLMRRCPVVDYSLRNRTALKTFGIDHARVLPIGYTAGLTRIDQAPAKEIDVLFYGCLNERRIQVLDMLKARGAIVRHLFGVYGAERDAAIARAKIVLNMHFYEAAIFESVRVSYLLANGCCVVTEGRHDDPDLAPFVGGMAITRFPDLADACMTLLGDESGRAILAHNGLAAMKRRRQADLLRVLFRA